MKQNIIFGIVLMIIALVCLLLPAYMAHGEPVDSVVYVEKPTLSSSQIIWLARLMDCESEITDEAINPNDLDNTPSWGILQFKPSTFITFAAKYGIEGELMSPEAQVSIVTYWILHPGEVRWDRQFPGCVARLGEPPIL